MQYHCFLHRFPLQSAGDLADRDPGTGTVETGADIGRVGKRLGMLEAGVKYAIEEILNRLKRIKKKLVKR